MLLLNVPVPVPLVVCASATVGFWEMLQQTPRAVTVLPPSAVTLPPQVAEVVAMLETLFVVTVGALLLTVTVLEAEAVQPYWLVPVTV